MKLTEAQRRGLAMVEKRDWPAGEPRIGWLNARTAHRLLKDALISKRAGSERSDPWGGAFQPSAIVDLTEAGRAALAAARQEGGER